MKKFKVIDLMVNIYLFLFAFTMINREFLFLGLDLRYILISLGVCLIGYKIIDIKKHKVPLEKDKNFIKLAMFFLWCITCNILWTVNDLTMETKLFINQMILIGNNFVALIVFYLYKNSIKNERVYKFIIFSCVILLISFILVSMGFKLSEISGSDVRAITRSTETAVDHKNMFGGNFRLAGYAEDPNYASLFFIIGIIATIKLKIKKRYKTIFILTFFVGFGLSWSKTLVGAVIVSALAIPIIKLFKFNNKVRNVLNAGILTMIVLSTVLLPKIDSIKEYMPSTLTTRFGMWNLASELFIENPITGNGIDSFKSYINEQYNGNWYVQCHSTYWQIISETGIIGTLLFLNVLFNLLKQNDKYNLDYFLVLVYVIWATTYETIAMQFTIAILYLLQLDTKEDEET